jgi:hypothetical protein
MPIPCQIGAIEILGGRPGRALSSDVQRLRPDRAEERSGRHQWHEGRRQGVTNRRRDYAAASLPSGRDRPGGGFFSEPTHANDAGIDIDKEKGPWYKSIGQGMGAALNTAEAANAYVLSDRGSWIHFKNKGDLQVLVEGDKRMFNSMASCW